MSSLVLNLIGNLSLQYGHLQNTRDIVIKIISKLTPGITRNFVWKTAPKKLIGIDRNKHTRENFRSFIKFFTLPIMSLPPIKNIEF